MKEKGKGPSLATKSSQKIRCELGCSVVKGERGEEGVERFGQTDLSSGKEISSDDAAYMGERVSAGRC